MAQFLSEGNQCNFQNITKVHPYTSTHDEPSDEEIRQGCIDTQRICRIILENAYVICGQIFNYRIQTSEKFIQNLYDFFLS